MHPENLLNTVLADAREDVRLKAVNLLKDAREKSSVNREVREFRPPVVNFNAQDYVDITDWASTSITPPPVLSDFFDEQIERAIQNLGFVYDLPEYPCHTQSVERTVQLVSKASSAVWGQERRDGFIRNTMASRKNIKRFKSKHDFAQAL